MIRPRAGERRRLVTAAIGLLAVAWLASIGLGLPPGKQPPLYDGVGFPDEPYRYVKPPPGAKATAPATDGLQTLPVQGGVPDLSPTSLENGPQVQAFVPGRTIELPAGARSVTARFRPLAPGVIAPSDGTIIGNVYRFSLTCSPGCDPQGTNPQGTNTKGPNPQGPVSFTPSEAAPAYVALRDPEPGMPMPAVETLRDGRWVRLPTTRDGFDIFGTKLTGLGDYALVRLTNSDLSTTPGGEPSGGLSGTAIALIVTLALLLLSIVAIRLVRSARGGSAKPPAG